MTKAIEEAELKASLFLFKLDMNASKEMLLRMILRCQKVRKHKPKKVKEPVLKIDSLDSPVFPDSEIKEKRFNRVKTGGVRKNLKNLV